MKEILDRLIGKHVIVEYDGEEYFGKLTIHQNIYYVMYDYGYVSFVKESVFSVVEFDGICQGAITFLS